MSQLIKATITPFESVTFKQNASLVSSEMLDTARRQAIARQQAFKVQNAVHSSSANSNYMTQVRQAFAPKSAVSPASQGGEPAAAAVPKQVISVPASEQSQVDVQAQAQAAYTQQRGSFEARVAKGELSYVPSLVMTVITQYPDVEFEYLGGFQYVPPSANPLGEQVDLSL